MVIDERELRQYLTTVADQAGAPAFTADAIADRIRRRRARITALVSGLVATACLAVAIPVALSGTSAPPPADSPASLVRPWVVVAVNGQFKVSPKERPAPSFAVTPGAHLTMVVEVTVPAHATFKALWLGIVGNLMTSSPDGVPELHPMLNAHTHPLLGPGLHKFTLHWVVPATLPPGARRGLSLGWTSSQPFPVKAQEIIAELVTRRT